MTTTYNLKNIRALLTEGFATEELRRFCHDEPDFRSVYNQLAGNTGKAEIVDRLLDYARQKVLTKKLLAWAKDSNPARYKTHRPYYYKIPTVVSDKVGGVPQKVGSRKVKTYTLSSTSGIDRASLTSSNDSLTLPISKNQQQNVEISEIISVAKQDDVPPAFLKMELKGRVIRYRITEPVTIIGRARDCHLEIPDEFDNVERYHAIIFYGQGNFTIADGYADKSTEFGTFVNKIKIEPQTRILLQSSDRIVLGGFRKIEISELARGACEIIFERGS